MIEQILQADRLLQVDQVDKARDSYQRVVDLDPGNAIAVVGLAQCALADGDDQKAHELAARALEIDPENDMARRMEARLSEILATRGETVERPDAAASASPREMRPVVTEDAPIADDALTAEDAATADDAAVAQNTPTADTETAAVEVPVKPAPPPPSPPPPRAKEPVVQKSFLDRLMGR